MKKFQNKSNVFRHSSDIVADAPQGLPCKHITSYFPSFPSDFPYQAALPAGKKADRRIWRMKSIVRRFVFRIYTVWRLPRFKLKTTSACAASSFECVTTITHLFSPCALSFNIPMIFPAVSSSRFPVGSSAKMTGVSEPFPLLSFIH